MTEIETQIRSYVNTLDHVEPVRAHDLIVSRSGPVRMRHRARRALIAVTAATVAGGALVVLVLAHDDSESDRGPSVAASANPKWTTVTDAAHGLSISFPPSWQAAPSTLTPVLFDPVVPIALGTYPLDDPQVLGECDIVPQRALEAMGRTDAFIAVYVFQGVGATFSPSTDRPEHFGPDLPWSGGALPKRANGNSIQCTENVPGFVGQLTFDDHGKHLAVLVAIGPEASSETRDEVYRILDTLTVTG